MGIQGLLPCLQSITHPATLERYRGLTVAVDAMCWLHKGVFATNVSLLAKEQWKVKMKHNSKPSPQVFRDKTNIFQSVIKRLKFDRDPNASASAHKQNNTTSTGYFVGESDKTYLSSLTKPCIAYTIDKAQLLEKVYNMKVILVIDGAPLPIKEKINRNRYEERLKAYRDGIEAESKGDTRAARRNFARACSITHEMRHQLVLACKEFNISFIVAPYEADAQLAELAQTGIVDVVITEDSDSLAYGCPRVLFKLNFDTGKGEEIQLMKDLVMNDILSFRNWTHDMFVYMCILVGCDYCEGVHGVGIKNAHKLVRMHRAPSRIFSALEKMGKLKEGFDDEFWRAYYTFRHQRVYCSESESLKMLMKPSSERCWTFGEAGDTAWDYLGSHLSNKEVKGIAIGTLHPLKKVPWEALIVAQEINDAHTDTTDFSSQSHFHGDSTEKKIGEKRLPLSPSTNEKNFLRRQKRKVHGQKEEIMKTRNSQNKQNQILRKNYSSELVGSCFKVLSRDSQDGKVGKKKMYNITQVVHRMIRRESYMSNGDENDDKTDNSSPWSRSSIDTETITTISSDNNKVVCEEHMSLQKTENSLPKFMMYDDSKQDLSHEEQATTIRSVKGESGISFISESLRRKRMEKTPHTFGSYDKGSYYNRAEDETRNVGEKQYIPENDYNYFTSTHDYDSNHITWEKAEPLHFDPTLNPTTGSFDHEEVDERSNMKFMEPTQLANDVPVQFDQETDEHHAYDQNMSTNTYFHNQQNICTLSDNFVTERQKVKCHEVGEDYCSYDPLLRERDIPPSSSEEDLADVQITQERRMEDLSGDFNYQPYVHGHDRESKYYYNQGNTNYIDNGRDKYCDPNEEGTNEDQELRSWELIATLKNDSCIENTLHI